MICITLVFWLMIHEHIRLRLKYFRDEMVFKARLKYNPVLEYKVLTKVFISVANFVENLRFLGI